MRSRLLVLLVLIVSSLAFSQVPTSSDPDLAKDKAYAIALERSGKYVESLPWLQKLHDRAPNDPDITESLADATLVLSAAAAEPEQQRQQRILARQLFQLSIDQGNKEPFAAQMVSYLPADGGFSKFSDNPEVHRLVSQGEAAFAKGNLDEAKDWYIRAVVLDPRNYDAALFAGDMYFRKNDPVAACEWFSRAAQIAPDRETAYRYWGDSLMRRHLYAQAREKYIEAVIAEPYGEFVWNGANNYLKGTKQQAKFLKIKPRGNIDSKDGKNVQITLDFGNKKGDDPSSVAWMMYSLTRASYRTDDVFKKQMPNEKAYRHTLKEEAAALKSAAEIAAPSDSKKKNKKSPQLPEDLAALVSLNEAGFIEPYVLLNVPDNDIVKDYEPYRKEHRDQLVKYLSEFVLPPAPPDDGAR